MRPCKVQGCSCPEYEDSADGGVCQRSGCGHADTDHEGLDADERISE